MADIFPLYVFPEGALSSSVITTVLIGVWITVFFNQRFGWVLSGLIVPGYLTPLILLEPLSAAIILVEAVITYGIVRLLAHTLADTIGWTTFFGRDRFFALILASIAVRLLMDVLLLPPLGTWLNAQYDLGFDWRRSLESFGLIIIALYANQFWKPGLLSGLLTSAVTIGLTVVIVRYGLMEFTNFRISEIGYLYELLAASLLASPKAYIIMITTAFIASRLNLRAGLDFNGLLIPALIALQWYEPSKILTSIFEAFVILGIAVLLLRLPIFANATIEGGRKLLLFFNISFLWKMMVGYVVLLAEFEFKTADAFGFGYLLSTLVALKLHDKGGEARMITALVVVSACGAFVGTAIGFALSEGGRMIDRVTERPGPLPPPSDAGERGDLIARVTDGPADPGSGQDKRSEAGVSRDETLLEGLRLLNAGLASESENLEELADARRKLALAGFKASRMADGTTLIERPISRINGGRILIDPASQSNLVIAVPRPGAVRGMGGAASALLKITGARALLLDGAPGVFRNGGAEQAERVFGGDILTVRGAEDGQAFFEVSGQFPADLDLANLQRVLGELPIRAGQGGSGRAGASPARNGDAILALPQEAVYRLISAVHDAPFVEATGPEGLAGYLKETGEGAPASAPRAQLSPAELIYAEREVLEPLLDDLIPILRASAYPTEQARVRLAALDYASGQFGYAVRLLTEPEGGARFVVLSSRTQGFGSFVFDLTSDVPVFVHLPSGFRDKRTYSFGTGLFESVQAHALLVAGPSERDGEAAPDLDILNPDHEPGLYDLVSKLLVASVSGESVSVVLRNVIARDGSPLPDADVIVSEDRLGGKLAKSDLVDGVLNELSGLGLGVRTHDGSRELAGFESGVLPQAGILSSRPDAVFLSLWLTPQLRAAFSDQSGATPENALFLALSVPSVTRPLSSLAEECFVAPDPGDHRVSNAIEALGAFAKNDNPVALQAAIAALPDNEFTRLVDPETLQSFLIARERGTGCIVFVANLNPISDAVRIVAGDTASRLHHLREFARSRTAALLLRDDRS